MKILFRTSRIANQFFFISTLAAWHYSCRKDIRDAWLRMTGKLTPSEEEKLAAFSRLMRTKYGFQSPKFYLGEIFFKQTDRNVWPALKKFIKDPKDYELLKSIFSMLDGRFKKIWKKTNHGSLEIIECSLREKRAVEFFNAIGRCFGGKNSGGNIITVTVLFSPFDGSRTAAGSANLTGNVVTLELPDLKKNTWQLSYSLATLGHEIAHMLFSERGGNDMIARIIKTLRLKKQYSVLPFSTLTTINEAITGAFAPLGVLGQIYFPRELKPLFASKLPQAVFVQPSQSNSKTIPYYGNLEIWFIWKLLPLSTAYTQKKKTLDKNFVYETGMLLKTIVG